MKLKLSCQENLADGKTFEDRCIALSDLGFQAVEIWGRDLIRQPQRVDAYASILDRLGLGVSVLVVGYRGGLLDPDPAQRDLAREDIAELLNIGGTLKAVGVIVVPVFGKPDLPDLGPLGTTPELADRLLVEQLKQLDGPARRAGTRIVLEPLNRGETGFLRTLDHAARLIDLSGADHAALMGDLFHMNIEETNTPETLVRHAAKLRHVHLADNTRLEPGTGSMDFAAVFAALKKINYRYYVSLECGFSTPDKNAGLKKAVDFLDPFL